ncbi:hypothetical protein D9M71_507390 [compost metagenome]
MGDAGEHQFALAAGLFDVLGHLVEGAVHLGHLAGDFRPQHQAHAAPLAELAGSEDQALERLAEQAHEDPRGGGGQQADAEEPAEHAPDLLAAQRVRVERHADPALAEVRRVDPEHRRMVDAQAGLGVRPQLHAHLPLEDFGVRPVVFLRLALLVGGPFQPGGFGDPHPRVLVRRPVGAHGQRRAVAVLAVDQHVLVHQQVDQRQRLGEQHDDQHHPQGAGEEALREPEGSFQVRGPGES